MRHDQAARRKPDDQDANGEHIADNPASHACHGAGEHRRPAPGRRPPKGAYPNRPVRIILPAAPGGPTDVMARVISPGLHARFGQPVIIVNRAGAGGNIGVVQAAKSPPDGYTLLIASTGFVVNPSLYRDPGYDPFRDFIPITELGSSPNVILVLPSSGIASLADLVAKAKADKEQTRTSSTRARARRRI